MKMNKNNLLIIYLTAVFVCLLSLPAKALSQDNFPTIKPVGFMHLWWQYEENEAKKVTKKIARARIGAAGNLSENIDYLVLAESGDLTYTNPATLLDAWLNIKVNPGFNIKIGQTWYKFTLSGTEILPKIPLIFRPEVVDAIWLPMGRNGSYAYDRGVEFWGMLNKEQMPFWYAVSVTAGSGLYYFENNNPKDVVARCWIEPKKGLRLGASGFKGASSIEMTSSIGSKKKKDLDEFAGGLEISYTQNKYRFISEYLQGYYDGYSYSNTVETYNTSAIKPRGYYALFGFKPSERIEFPVQYAFYEKNFGAADTGLTSITFGITWTIKKNTLNNVKLNYILKDAESNYGSKPEDMAALQIQFML